MIAITIILPNNVSSAFLLVKMKLIEYMSFYLTDLFADGRSGGTMCPEKLS